MEEFRRKLYRAITPYHNNYTYNYLDEKSVDVLLTMTHPLDRQDLQKEYLNLQANARKSV